MEQVRLYDLLKYDKFFRKWLGKEPKLTVYQAPTAKPWRLFIQEEKGGSWKRGDTQSFGKALRLLTLKLPEVHDLALHCKPQGFNPPRLKLGKEKFWLPGPTDHRWCIYCRRYTLFDYFNRHPNMIHIPVNPEVRLCLICGAREEPMPIFDTSLLWPLSVGQ